MSSVMPGSSKILPNKALKRDLSRVAFSVCSFFSG